MTLDEYLLETSKKKFKWGECDCLLFVSDWIKLKINKDPMSKQLFSDPDTIRGKYNSKRQAYVLIHKYRTTLENIMDVCLNRVDVRFAKKGDIVICKIGDMRCFGVVFHGGQAVFKTENEGLHFESLKNCEYAWAVK